MAQYILRNLRFPVQRDYDLSEEAAKKLKLPLSSFAIERIIRKAVDTRRKNLPIYDFTVSFSFTGKVPTCSDLSLAKPPSLVDLPAIKAENPHPYIIGMGPAGLFCALAMVENGLQPYLFDQGDPLEERATRVEAFWQDGILDEDSNTQFGEGGAGAFSDGKLTSRSADPEAQQVLDWMVRFGANPDIVYESLPHLGTDGIRLVIRNIREFLLSQGCQFFYRSRLEDLEITGKVVSRVKISAQWHSPELLILGLGNSSRSTFRMLHARGMELEAKPFALGLRIEQKQEQINSLIYGGEKWADILGPASYRLTSKSGFSFCMCPGGYVIGASSDRDSVVTNGMSFSHRNNPFCNSAIVTPVSSVDFGNGLWDGMELQTQLEQRAFHAGYLAPAQSAEGFVKGVYTESALHNTFRPGVYGSDLSELFPPGISERLRGALVSFDGIFKGFYACAELIAPETRTSSPIRILRDKLQLHSVSAENLYPIGEGSGYSGGIVSSAVDGLRLGKRLRLSTA